MRLCNQISLTLDLWNLDLLLHSTMMASTNSTSGSLLFLPLHPPLRTNSSRVCQTRPSLQRWTPSCLRAMTPQPVESPLPSTPWPATLSTSRSAGMRSSVPWMARTPWSGRNCDQTVSMLWKSVMMCACTLV